MDDKFDGLFMSVVQQSQGIDGFLNSVFGFLKRKTDFYAFPDKAQELIQKHSAYHQEIFLEQKRLQEEKQKQEKLKQEAEKAKQQQKQQQKKEEGPVIEEITEEEAQKIEAQQKKKQNVEEVKQEIKPIEKQEPKEEKAEKTEKAEGEGEGEGENKTEGEEKSNKQAPIDNGGITDTYQWTQTLQEVTMYIWIDKHIKGKDIQVKLKASTIQVKVQNKLIIDGQFHKQIKPDDEVWIIDSHNGRRCIQLTFTKLDGMSWWNCVVKGDPEIDTQKVQPENSKLEDLDCDTRTTVEKMMFDQRQKAMGKPTSDEMEKQSKLSEFMKTHPELDFSKCKFS